MSTIPFPARREDQKKSFMTLVFAGKLGPRQSRPLILPPDLFDHRKRVNYGRMPFDERDDGVKINPRGSLETSELFR